jgi:hypothetical protein
MRLRSIVWSTVLAAVVSLMAPVHGRADDALFGVRVGYYTKLEEPMIGGEVLLRLAPSFYFNPNVEYVFTEGSTYLTFNADAHYDLPTHSRTFVWLGAGLGVISVDPDGPREESTDVVANFLAGVGFKRGGLIPYFQAKLIAKDDTEFVLAFGVRF